MMRRRFVGAVGAFFLLFATVSATADAQGLLGLFGCGGSTECIRSAGKTVTVERFDPVLPGRYPAIILLHGSDGMEVHQREYEGVAQRLAGSGYVAILLHYYDATGTPEQPVSWDILESSRYRVWKRVVKDAISYASCLENVDSDRIGLVGFSLGAVLGASVSVEDSRVKSLVAVSGGPPPGYRDGFKHMPPTLILHGEIDERIPAKAAYRLADMLAKRCIPHQLVVYPCQGHTFDEQTNRDGSARGLAFLNQTLK